MRAPSAPLVIPGDDILGLVARGLGAGLLLGLALHTAVALGVRTLQIGAPAGPAPDLSSPAATFLLIGTLSAAAAVAAATWWMLRAIGNPWRQGMFALLAAFGSFALSLVAMPVDRLLGRAGLAGLALIAGLLAWRVARPVIRPPAS